MAHAHPIEMSTWTRREHFEHYRTRRPTYFAITIEADVTALEARLRAAGRTTYPAHTWALASVVNRHDEFRTTLDSEGRPAVWDVVDPSFTVFNAQRETLANVWAPYEEDFGIFHDRAAGLIAQHRSATTPFPQGFPPPANLFDISSIPWTFFTGFTLHVENGWDHLAPVFTLGKYVDKGGRLLMPVALQIHHAVADGFHACRLLEDLQELFAAPEWVA